MRALKQQNSYKFQSEILGVARRVEMQVLIALVFHLPQFLLRNGQSSRALFQMPLYRKGDFFTTFQCGGQQQHLANDYLK